MSNPTGNAIQAAAIPDAREARLLALVANLEAQAIREHAFSRTVRRGWEQGFAYGQSQQLKICAKEILAALRGDA